MSGLVLLVFAAALPRDVADSLQAGLESLASTQNPDGSWPGSYGRTTGIVASCTLAFLATGNPPGRGKCGSNCARSVGYLLKHAKPNGLIYTAGMSGGPMYHHGLATLALAEVWGETHNRRVRDCLRRAIDLIVRTQNSAGGWRYEPRPRDADISVTVMQLMALRAARDAGISVPKDIIDGGIEYVKSCWNASDGGFAYTPRGGSGFARTGAGVTSLQVCGDYKSAEVKRGVDYILQHTEGKKIDQWYYYGVYYASQGVYQWGGEAWDKWNAFITQDLLSKQTRPGNRDAGSWRGSYHPYDSAMALLVLSIPYHYLPIYQR